MADVTKIDSSRFQNEVLGADVPVLVDFYADWCPPCRAIAPTLEKLAGDFEGRAKIAKVNVDENPDLAGRYNVRSIPTLVLFEDGEATKTQVGAPPAAVLRGLLDGAVSAESTAVAV